MFNVGKKLYFFFKFFHLKVLLYDTFANVISAANIPCQESLSSDLLVEQEEQERKLESIWSNNPITTVCGSINYSQSRGYLIFINE